MPVRDDTRGSDQRIRRAGSGCGKRSHFSRDEASAPSVMGGENYYLREVFGKSLE